MQSCRTWWSLLFLTSLAWSPLLANHLQNHSYWDDDSYEDDLSAEAHDLHEHKHEDPDDHVMVIDMPVGDEHPIEEAPRHLVKAIDPNSPAISFSAENEFKGAELFFDGHGLSLPRPFKTKSHRFKGGVNWTIYPGSNYTGSAMCLISDPGHPVTGNGQHDITVGSIRRGCWCNDSMIMVKARPRSRLAGSSLSGVQVWSNRNAEGATAYTDGRETRFPYPIEMESFQLLGRWIPWTLFSKPEFKGDSSCLVADREGGGANYAFINIPRPFIVSSVQQACVATSSFEFAGVEETPEPGKEGDKVQVVGNEVPVMPETAGGGLGSSGGSTATGGGGGGSFVEKGQDGSEMGNKIETEGTSDNGDAKGRGGPEGGASSGTRVMCEAMVIGFGLIYAIPVVLN